MKLLHLLYAGKTGGIEKLCKDMGLYAQNVDNYFLFAHTGGQLCEEMQAAGLNVYCYSYENKDIRPLRKEIIQLCGRLGIDAVLIHHPAPLFWLACMPLMKREKPKFLVYAHNNYEELTGGRAWKRILYNRLLNKAAGVIAISEFVKNSVVAGSGVNPDKVHVVYNGVHVEDYAGVQNHRTKGVLRLLYVGRLIQKKGLQVLLEALTYQPEDSGIRLDIVGDGAYRSTLEAYVQEKGLEKRVTFHGEQRGIAEYMQEADVFVHPAIWEEGFGITLIEALSAGLVCVAFNKGALSEIILDGKTGYLVETVDALQLSDKLMLLRDMEEKSFDMMKAEAKKRAHCFSIDRLEKQLLCGIKGSLDGR